MTLVELMVGLLVLLIVLGIATASYLKVLRSYRTESKISEAHMQDVAGLELLRYDIEMAGYGLPSNMGTLASYSEAAGTGLPAGANDSPDPPRALVSQTNTAANGSAYISVKSQVAGTTITTGKKSSIIYNNGGIWVVKQWGDTQLDFSTGDRFIVMDGFRTLQQLNGSWSFNFIRPGYFNNSVLGTLPTPAVTTNIFLAYGVDPDTNLRMPFNRVDYYLSSTNLPARCSPNSYVLYRAAIDHSDGSRGSQPILDCVRDFQVAFGLDANGDGLIDTGAAWPPTLAGLTAAQIAQQLKEIRIFILLHEGQRDGNFFFSGTLNLGDKVVCNDSNFTTLSSGALTSALSSYTPAGGGRNYRWKVLKLAIKPKNFGS